MTDLAILASYAHPDDEQGVSGTLRLCLDQGIRVALVCATRGEVGEISDPALATPETLGEVRENELRRATDIIGFSDVYFLDYRDSGMDGTPENQDPRAFVNAPEDEAVGRIVKVIREFKPSVIVTFDETGGYGHPDHLAIHRWTCDAFNAAGNPARYPDLGQPFAPRRLFVSSFPRSVRKEMIKFIEENGIESFLSRLPPDKYGLSDDQITNRVKVAQYLDLKRRALGEHKTQFSPNGPWARIPPEVSDGWRSVESFAFAAGEPLPADADPGDLFAGLR
jgi:LmbE family N-acetylglucosaminyl deacetylase